MHLSSQYGLWSFQLFFIFHFLTLPRGTWGLVSPAGVWAAALEAWGPDRWATREVPEGFSFLMTPETWGASAVSKAMAWSKGYAIMPDTIPLFTVWKNNMFALSCIFQSFITKQKNKGFILQTSQTLCVQGRTTNSKVPFSYFYFSAFIKPVPTAKRLFFFFPLSDLLEARRQSVLGS